MSSNTTFKKNDPRINRKGRPRLEHSITEELRVLGTLPPGEERQARVKVLADKLWALALSGDEFAMKTVIERIDGKVKNVLEVENKSKGLTPENLAIIEKKLRLM